MFESTMFLFSFLLLIATLILGVFFYRAGSSSPRKNLVLPALVLMVSLVSLTLVLRLDNLVHGDLYKYGLVFDEAWAGEYWLLQRTAMGLLAVNIALAVVMVVKNRFRLMLMNPLPSPNLSGKYPDLSQAIPEQDQEAKKPETKPKPPKIHKKRKKKSPKTPVKSLEEAYREENPTTTA